jgi:hypothetical protein
LKAQVNSQRGGGEWEIFRNSSNSNDFDENHSEAIETQGKLNHHKNIKHAYMIHIDEEHVIIQAFKHEEDELKK